jgi:hypothetical protein
MYTFAVNSKVDLYRLLDNPVIQKSFLQLQLRTVSSLQLLRLSSPMSLVIISSDIIQTSI